MSIISQFQKGGRAVHFEWGGGAVVYRDAENVGIVWDNGCRGTYGISHFERFPSLITLPPAPVELRYDQRLCTCGQIATADFVDNGVGMQQCGPFSCEACGWVENGGEVMSIDELGHLPEDF